MAPSRGKGKAAMRAAGGISRTVTRRSKRAGASTYTDDDVADVYKSMLAEVEAEDHTQVHRPLKRPRMNPTTRPSDTTTAEDHAADIITSSSPIQPIANASSGLATGRVQIIEDSSDSEESDLEFEDVDLENPADPMDEQTDGIDDLSIDVQPEHGARLDINPRRNPATTVEKAHRLLVHKLHLLCLLGHCMYVNGRCNNTTAQMHIRSNLTSKTTSYLNPKQDDSQFQRNRSFMDGLQQAVDAFVAQYRVNGSGLMKPKWSLDGDEPEVRETGLGPTDSSDFILAAKELEGSQDMGNQLFCTLLRAVGVDARIVCSLQPLPFSSIPKGSTPKKAFNKAIITVVPKATSSTESSGGEDTAVLGSSTIGRVPSARRRLGQPNFAAESSRPLTPRKRTRPVPKLQYPVFWVEAFNKAQQKWIAVDPVVTNTINKPSKLEPPASYDLAQLTYVIACEDDGTARDVTRRYAKAFNAKTRRHRVESSQQGARWWNLAMRVFRRRGGKSDRDQIEDAELAQKEAREGMPANVLDFKDHPYYALERHLKRHETIHPKREVGKVNAGTAAKPRVEPVFRRRDVQMCKSADKWYRLGREIIEGEQPLKHVPSRAKRQMSVGDSEEKADTSTALYAPYQTQLYTPPPVQRGRIPKNVYGNLDIYVPSMVPPGGIHIRHGLAQKAARLLKIDFSDAVTGFKFQGRHGTAIIEGAVVAEQYADAVQAVIDSIEYDLEVQASKARSLIALRMWKRFMTGLRVAERVSKYGDPSEAQQVGEADDELVADPHGILLGQAVDDPLITAGHFTVAELSMRSKPANQRKRRKNIDTDDDVHEEYEDELQDDMEGGEEDLGLLSYNGHSEEEGGGFIPEVGDGGGGFIPEDNEGGGEFLTEQDADADGGFLPDAGSDHGGGFVPDDDELDNDLFDEESKMPPLEHISVENQVHAQPQDQPQPGPSCSGQLDENEPNEGTPMKDTGYELVEHSKPDETEQTAKQISPETPPSASQASQIRGEQDSLPSEDPEEDEDAEPDWLESD